jgi:hypothetical protein
MLFLEIQDVLRWQALNLLAGGKFQCPSKLFFLPAEQAENDIYPEKKATMKVLFVCFLS